MGGRIDWWGGVSGEVASTDRNLCLRRPEAVLDLCPPGLSLGPGGFGLCFWCRGPRGNAAPLPRGGVGLALLCVVVSEAPFPDLFGAVAATPAAAVSDPRRPILLPEAFALLPRGGRSEEPCRLWPALLLARRAGLDFDVDFDVVDFAPLPPERDTLATTALCDPMPEDSMAADCLE